MVKPFLPNIIENCVGRVSAAFQAREVDPFQVFFDKGIIQQVRRSVYNAQFNFPLVWLVYKYAETFGNGIAINSTVNFQLIIAMPTETAYTQEQRESISFLPRLLPIYHEIMKEFKREKWFNVVGDNGIKHTMTLLPYWGMGDVEATDVDNLFKGRYIDAISVQITGLAIRRSPCGTGLNSGYPVPDTNGYPISGRELTFFDDLELIVDGGETYDPVHKESHVIIPFLKGKTFSVEQRMFGTLRQRREIEILPDLENGGFYLLNGMAFSTGDTYFIKIKPMYLAAL